MDYELWLRFLKYGAKFESVDEVYGYFRWYPGQKSTEEWQSTGLPEIAKLQKEYFGTKHICRGDVGYIYGALFDGE